MKKARARQLLDAGVSPSENRRAAKAAQMEGAANSFEVVTREWIDQQMKPSVKCHSERILTRFERDIFPWIGARPIEDSDGAGTAHNSQAYRKTRRVGDRASRARQLRPGVPLHHRHRPRQTRSDRRSARCPEDESVRSHRPKVQWTCRSFVIYGCFINADLMSAV